MKPTDEDVMAVAKQIYEADGRAKWAHFTGPWRESHVSGIRAVIEAYTPRLIERLAREAEETADMARGTGYPEQAPDWQAKADWLRSFVEKNHD